MNVRQNGQEFVEAEGAHYQQNWNRTFIRYNPGEDDRDMKADFVRRIVAATPPRGEYDYGPSFE